ncbi:MAG: acetyl xylan esterase [Verrucomicrobiales bacterium]|jgi:hypothetical protein|nr:acetyl xylan esterase [Verrucomicrobiales bacterium]|tara:strand:- start:43496 stop:44203 length:708 start_codon:yes stop_codon:yes gene_type:complete
MKFFTTFLPIGLLSLVPVDTFFAADEGKHLFILSGQSNMAGHRPEEAFIPAVEEAFGKENVIVIQDAVGGQPIQRWYKAWKDPASNAPDKTGDLYDRLLDKVKQETEGKAPASVSFFWMQGERDAKMGWAPVYEKSLLGLYQQLSDDLGRDDVIFVIGRLSDYGVGTEQWDEVRAIQVRVADSDKRFSWVDTDDLNDGKNRRGKEIKDDLHYSDKGYRIFGERMAAEAIQRIKGK